MIGYLNNSWASCEEVGSMMLEKVA